MKEKVAQALAEAATAGEREELLLALFYEMSRELIPKLGPPRKSQEYLESQGVLLDLIGFLGIALIRNNYRPDRGVVVLTEIAEGCADPVLRKKLAVYAQELLVKARNPETGSGEVRGGRSWWLFGGALALVALGLATVLLFSFRRTATVNAGEEPGPPLSAGNPPTTAYHAEAGQGGAAPAGSVLKSKQEQPKTLMAAADGGGATAQGDRVTKVRIVNNQVLVPVLLKHGSESVRAELVLDTGSSRTAIHEELALKLRIDLRKATASQAELADGRMLRSKVTPLDSLSVGPYSMSGAEVELIPYQGSEGIHDGLLGMDFLGRHRYQIDMEGGLIRWY